MGVKLLAVFLLAASTVVEGNIGDSNFGFPDYGTTLSAAVIKTIRGFHKDYSSTIYVATRYKHPSKRQRQMDLLNEIMYFTMNTYAYKVEYGMLVSDSHYRIHNLYIVDSYKSIHNITRYMTRIARNAHLGFYTVVITEIIGNYVEVLQRIFRDFWGMYIVNVIVLYENVTNGNVDLYTYFPFTEHHCRKIIPVPYNTFNGSAFEKELPLFPKKTRNFHQCPLYIITWQYPPLMVLMNTTSGSEIVSGIDGHVLRNLARTLNFTLKLIIPPKNTLWGVIHKNSTITGAINMILNKQGDLTMCGYGSTYERQRIMSASVPYYIAYLVLVIAPPTTYSSFRKLFFPFKEYIWTVFILCFITEFITVSYLRYKGLRYKRFVAGNRNRTSLLNMINMFFGGTITKAPKRNFARFLFLLWLVGTTVMRSSYQGSLVGIMQNKQPISGPRTVNDIINSNFPIYVPESLSSALIGYKKLRARFVLVKDILDYLPKMHTPGYQGAVITTNLLVLYYNNENYKNTALRTLPENLFTYPMSIFFPKNSFLKDPFDREIQKQATAGLIIAWANQQIDTTLLKESSQNGYQTSLSLSNSDLMGCYQFCHILIVVSVCVFILEIISVKIPLLRKFFEFLAKE